MANTNTSVIISQIYKSRKNVLELMESQGYDVSGYANFSIVEINAMKQNNQLDMLLESKNNTKVYIKYYMSKIKTSNIAEMIDDLFIMTETLKKTDTLYIIIKDNINETIMNELKHIWERDGIFIVVENIKNLQFNILKHKYVHPHSIISDQEVAEVMTKYNISSKEQFPDISRFDPVARAICIRPDQVCRIMRPSETAIETPYYRRCI